MKRVPQSEESLVEHLTEQVSFLCTSHKSFDDGFEGEAKRIAHILRVLLHDTRRSFSLLRQLGILEQFMYRDTSIPWFEQNSNGPVDGLTRMVISTEYVKPQAPLDDLSGAYSNCLKNFPNWWSQPVIRDNNDFVFTRRDLILNVANTDGGSHVDPALDAQYSALTRDNSMGWWDGKSVV